MAAPVWASLNVLDQGPNYIKTKITSVCLVDYAYTAGDSYATFRGAANANVIAEKTGLTSTNVTLANQGTNGRKATIDASTGNTAAKDSSGAAGQLKIAALDTVNLEVLAVWDVTSDQVIANGNPVDFSALVYNVNQPTG